MNEVSPNTTAAAEVEATVVALREKHPGASITGEVIEGRVVDGITVEVHGYLGAPLIEVKTASCEAATDLVLAELEGVRSERQSCVWPPR